jgi:hypothetical protein
VSVAVRPALAVEVAPGGSTPVVDRSAGGTRLVVLLDGSGSWSAGAEAARRCHDHLVAAALPEDLGPGGVRALLAASLTDVPADWRTDGFAFSVLALLARGTRLWTVSAGMFGAVRLGADGVTVLCPRDRLVDRLVRAGRMTADEAEVHPARHVVAGFEGDPSVLRVRTDADALAAGRRGGRAARSRRAGAVVTRRAAGGAATYTDALEATWQRS